MLREQPPKFGSWPTTRPASGKLTKPSRVPRKYKTPYRVGNWREYERALVQRGDVTLWLSADATDAWRTVALRSTRRADAVLGCGDRDRVGPPARLRLARAPDGGVRAVGPGLDGRTAEHVLSPFLRLRTFPLPVAPTRANVDGRRLPAAATKEGPSP